jgi:hypothetical protein
MSLSSSPFESPQSPPPQPRSKAPWIILLVVVGGIVLVPCICGGVLLGLAGRGISMAVTERANVEQVVNTYLQKMEDKDVAGAFALFSSVAQRKTPQSEVQRWVNGPDYGVFSDYKSATVSNIQIQSTTNRTMARVHGTVSYEGGVTGTFQAVVGREGDAWLIDGINVTVPPSKLGQAKPE